MEPTLRAGDKVRVRAGGRLVAGEVALIDGRGQLLLHRVLIVIPGTRWLIHCGDAGRRGGPGLVGRGQVIGVAELPRRRPSLETYLATASTLARAVARSVLRRIAGRSSSRRA